MATDTHLTDIDARKILRDLMDVPPTDECCLPPSVPGLSVLGITLCLKRQATDPPGRVRREIQFWYATTTAVFFGWVRSLCERGALRVVEIVDSSGTRIACDFDAADLCAFHDFGCATEKSPCAIVVEWAKDDFESPPVANFVLWGVPRDILERYAIRSQQQFWELVRRRP